MRPRVRTAAKPEAQSGGRDRAAEVRTKPRTVVSWSSGKDSAFALWEARREGRLDVVGLLTTVTDAFGRVSIHGVRERLLDLQAEAVGLPVYRVRIPYPCPNETYERAMATAVEAMHRDGVRRLLFGDLYLSDVRAYREERLASTGIVPEFPLWGQDTSKLARSMIGAGLVAHVVSLDPRRIPRELAGRRFDEEFLEDLPESADPCGENGEFHTFVSDGPMLRHPIRVRTGATVERDGFLFTDLEPVGEGGSNDRTPAPPPVPADRRRRAGSLAV